jgi:CRISPR-associated protein Csm3
MKLKDYAEIRGKITCKTGLRIGGTVETVGIGETDNPIIRHPITRMPYIPGSSLKGKLRSLLETKYSPRTQATGRPCDCAECEICVLFGCGDPRGGKEPTRLIFRDAALTEESAKSLSDALPGAFVEVKTEIAMDRNLGSTRRGSLRQQERVPEGTEFDFSISVRMFVEDESGQSLYLDRLAEAFEMLEKDYLGGSGTRGYGQVLVTTEDGQTPIANHIRG